jgi:enoyl-CoA hydratase/carnithine racemase
VFDNPARRNAVSLGMWEAIPRVLEDFGADPEVRVVVLAGAGDKAFVSGADISQFESQRSGREAVQRYEEIAEGAQLRLQGFDKPTIAMIRGYCLGAGVNIANVCDLRIAANDARFGIPAARVGLAYRVSSTKNLVDVVGAPNARDLLLTGRQI